MTDNPDEAPRRPRDAAEYVPGGAPWDCWPDSLERLLEAIDEMREWERVNMRRTTPQWGIRMTSEQARELAARIIAAEERITFLESVLTRFLGKLSHYGENE